MSSNIPSAPAYGVYASQLIRYARCCSNYCDFLLRHRALVTRLLSQGYKVNRLSNTFKKFYGIHTDLVGQYKKMSAKCLLILSLSIFHNFPATYHLALLMVYTFHSSLDMHDAAHTMMISDIATSAWLIDFCHKAI